MGEERSHKGLPGRVRSRDLCVARPLPRGTHNEDFIAPERL